MIVTFLADWYAFHLQRALDAEVAKAKNRAKLAERMQGYGREFIWDHEGKLGAVLRASLQSVSIKPPTP